MIYLIVDTNNWIYLANSKNPDTGNFEDGRHIKLFDTLMEKVDGGQVELLVCPEIEAEWQRNKVQTEELIKKYQQEAVGQKGVIKKMAKSLDASDKKTLTVLYEKHVTAVESIINENHQHIGKIEALIQKATKYNITQETKAFAADWAVAKKAPFIGDKKNSMADAYIFFGAVAHLKEIAKVEPQWGPEPEYKYPTSIFVSGNKGDFSNPANADSVHEDLKPFSDEVQLNFFRSLPTALNFIQQHIEAQPPIFSEDEIQAIEEDIDSISDDWYTCDVCTPDDEDLYTNMVYFSEPYEIDVEAGNVVDPNQLAIQFADLQPEEPRKSHKIMIRTGECSLCNTTHLICDQCGTVTPIEGENDSGFECDGCGINYLVKQVHEGKGIYHQEISIVRGSPVEE